MDTFSASFLAGFAAEVAGGVVLEMGRSLKGKFGPGPQRAALERSIHMGTVALISPPSGLDSAVLDQLQLGLKRFFLHGDACAALVDLIRGNAQNLQGLDALFREQVFGVEDLLELDAQACLQRFQMGFWKQAQLESDLAAVIIVGQLQEQTDLQRQTVAWLAMIYENLGNYRQVETLGLVTEGPRARTIKATNVAGVQIFIGPDAMPDHGPAAQMGWRPDYLKELRRKCLILPLDVLGGDAGQGQGATLDQVYVGLDTTTILNRLEGGKGGQSAPQESGEIGTLFEALFNAGG